MIADLRYIQELRKENEHLQNVLVKEKLTDNQRKIIKEHIKRNNAKITEVVAEVTPFIEKLPKDSRKVFVKSYYIDNETSVKAEMNACENDKHLYELNEGNFARDCKRILKDFWKLYK